MIGATHVRVGTALFGAQAERLTRMRFDGLIFDFDGVLLESE